MCCLTRAAIRKPIILPPTHIINKLLEEKDEEKIRDILMNYIIRDSRENPFQKMIESGKGDTIKTFRATHTYALTFTTDNEPMLNGVIIKPLNISGDYKIILYKSAKKLNPDIAPPKQKEYKSKVIKKLKAGKIAKPLPKKRPGVRELGKKKNAGRIGKELKPRGLRGLPIPKKKRKRMSGTRRKGNKKPKNGKKKNNDKIDIRKGGKNEKEDLEPDIENEEFTLPGLLEAEVIAIKI
jgi:hypothetical protein